MPDEQIAAATTAIVEKAADRAKEPHTFRVLLVITCLIAVAAIVLFGLVLSQYQQVTALNGQVGGLESQVGGLKSTVVDYGNRADQLGQQVSSLGKVPVVAPPGQVGATGRGIASTTIRDGHLILSFTDGTTSDAGAVAGSPGVSGVSITGTVLAAGNLIVTYSDGHSSDLGSVVGPAGAGGAPGVPGQPGAAGRSVTSVANSNGHLIVTYSDGSTQDAGTLPPGPAGPAGPNGANGADGAAGDPPSGFTFTDVTGRTYDCTPDTPAGPGSSPHYTCTGGKP